MRRGVWPRERRAAVDVGSAYTAAAFVVAVRRGLLALVDSIERCIERIGRQVHVCDRDVPSMFVLHVVVGLFGQRGEPIGGAHAGAHRPVAGLLLARDEVLIHAWVAK